MPNTKGKGKGSGQTSRNRGAPRPIRPPPRSTRGGRRHNGNRFRQGGHTGNRR